MTRPRSEILADRAQAEFYRKAYKEQATTALYEASAAFGDLAANAWRLAAADAACHATVWANRVYALDCELKASEATEVVLTAEQIAGMDEMAGVEK